MALLQVRWNVESTTGYGLPELFLKKGLNKHTVVFAWREGEMIERDGVLFGQETGRKEKVEEVALCL